MRRETRIKILSKLAKKDANISGRLTQKEIQKLLDTNKKNYNKVSSELTSVKDQIIKLKEQYDKLKEEQDTARNNMKLCHKLIRDMDFAGAAEARIGKDQDDVAYSVEGKWYSYDDDNGLSKYEKKKKKIDDSDVNDASDTEDDSMNPQPDVPSDDISNVIDKFVPLEKANDVTDDLHEGIDVTV